MATAVVTEKKWYRKFKVLTGLATILTDLIILICAEIFAKEVSPAVIQIMGYVFGMGIALITGHTITDSVAASSKSKK